MRIGVISDAHGNPSGLRACLDFLAGEKVGEIYFLGDSVGYMPAGGSVLDALARAQARCIRGNHEEMLLGNLALDEQKNKVYRLDETRKTLSKDQVARLGDWPLCLDFVMNGKRIFMTHGSPWDYVNDYIYPDSDLTRFGGLPYDAVFIGQTHRPFIERSGRVLVVNVGSCGMPRDQGNLASCAVYESESGECNLFRVPFDTRQVIAEIGSEVHPSVVECLRRTAKSPVVGRIVPRSGT